MWKWPAFAAVVLLLVLLLGILLFRSTPEPPPPPPIDRKTPDSQRPVSAIEARAARETPSRTLIPPPDPIAAPTPSPAPTPAPTEPARLPEGSGEGGSATAKTAADPGAEVPAVEHHTWPSDAVGIRGAVRESLPDLKHCYEEWQKTSPELRGKVKIGFTISTKLDLDAGSAPEATVSSVRIGESDLDHVFMEGCVKSVFGELRFEPPTDGEMQVTYPITFDNVEPPQ